MTSPAFLKSTVSPYSHFKAVYFIKIMEGGPHNFRSGNSHRPQVRYGSYCSGPADLHLNAFQHRGSFFCRKFKSNGKTRGFSGITQKFLQVAFVDFNNDAVYMIVLTGGFFLPLFPKGNNFFNILGVDVMRVNFKTEFGK